MKTSFLTTALLIAGLAGFAQNSFQVLHYDDGNRVVSNGDNLFFSVGSYEEVKTYFDVVNTTGSAQNYIVQRYDTQLHSSSTETAVTYYCFGITCYLPETKLSDPVAIAAGDRTSNMDSGIPGQKMMLYPSLTDIENPGYSIVKYTVFNANNHNDSIQFSMYYNHPSVGISKNRAEKMDVKLAPNPASDKVEVNFSLNNSGECAVKIYNALGALVRELNVSRPAGNSTLKLDVSDLRNGLYFLSVGTGNSTSIQRLIVH